MTSQLSSENLSRLSLFVRERIGFSYSPDRISDLSRGFMAACHDLGTDDPESCLKKMDDSHFCSVLEEELIKKLTIGETYFFRDRNLFAHLRDRLLPDLIQSRRTSGKYLRIWCAACSTGEEPYSIAILLRYLLPDIGEWEITILGTDINPGSLHAAERGIYSKWSFREQTPVPIEPYISPALDGRFHVSPDIRKMIRFSRLNLISDPYPSVLNGITTMDLVLCRNVLMYFSPDLASLVVDRLNSTLIFGGWLVVSPQEISFVQRPDFHQIKHSSVFLFQKGLETEKSDEIFTIPSGYTEPSSDFRTDDYRNKYPGLSDSYETVIAHPTLSPHQDIIRPHTEEFPSYEENFQKNSWMPDAGSLLIRPDRPGESPSQLILAGKLAEAEYLLLQNNHPDKKTLEEIEMLARIFADQGDLERALGWCDRILAVDPLSPAAYHLRAVIQQDKGEFTSAIQSLRQALYADPDYIPAHLMLGMIMRNQGKQAESRRHYQVALRILSAMPDDTLVEETDGMPAARVRDMVTVLLGGGKV